MTNLSCQYLIENAHLIWSTYKYRIHQRTQCVLLNGHSSNDHHWNQLERWKCESIMRWFLIIAFIYDLLFSSQYQQFTWLDCGTLEKWIIYNNLIIISVVVPRRFSKALLKSKCGPTKTMLLVGGLLLVWFTTSHTPEKCAQQITEIHKKTAIHVASSQQQHQQRSYTTYKYIPQNRCFKGWQTQAFFTIKFNILLLLQDSWKLFVR